MLESIRTFVGQKILRTDPATNAPQTDARRPLQLAACAILLELAHADGEFTADERAHIESAMTRHFGLDEASIGEVMELAEAERRQAIDHFQFTRMIAKHYDLGQKMLLAEIMWGVILADGRVNEHEAYIVRKVANLLELEPAYLAQARRTAGGT